MNNFNLMKEYGISLVKAYGGKWCAFSGTIDQIEATGVQAPGDSPEAALIQCLAIAYPELTEQGPGFEQEIRIGDQNQEAPAGPDYRELFIAAKAFIDSLPLEKEVTGDQANQFIKYMKVLDINNIT